MARKIDVEIRERPGCLSSLKTIGIALLVIVVTLVVLVQACRDKEGSEPIATAAMPPMVTAETVPGETTAPAQPQKIFLGEHVAAYKKKNVQEYNPQIAKHFAMGGVAYYHGLTIGGWTNNDGLAHYNLSGYGFHTVKGQVGCLDDMHPEGQGILSFYGDDILLKQITMKPDKLPTNFEIDITGVNQLRINCSNTIHWGVKAGLADVIFE